MLESLEADKVLRPTFLFDSFGLDRSQNTTDWKTIHITQIKDCAPSWTFQRKSRHPCILVLKFLELHDHSPLLTTG